MNLKRRGKPVDPFVFFVGDESPQEPEGTVVTIGPDAETVRRRSARARAEAEVQAENERQSKRDHLEALQRERVGFEERLARLRTYAHLTYIVPDPSGLTPPPHLVVGGTLGGLVSQVERDLASLDEQIAAAKAELDTRSQRLSPRSK